VDDDEALLRYFAGDEAVAAMRATGPRKSSLSISLVDLIEEISKRETASQVYIRRSGLTLRMERRGASG
jgi:hypothetical protein